MFTCPARLALRFALAALCAGAVLAAEAGQAVELYRWVDERGRTNVSDTVPEKYKPAAERIDSRQFEVDPRVRRQAIERVGREHREAARPGASPRLAANDALRVGQTPAANAANCATLRKEYMDSQACFAPFRNASGSLRAEAFQKCAVVADPSNACGIPRLGTGE